MEATGCLSIECIIPRHSCVFCTLSLTKATVSANSSSCVQLAGAGSGVHGNRLANNKSIANQFSNCLSGVGIGDFVDFVRIEPDLALAAAHYGRSKALLSSEVGPKITDSSAFIQSSSTRRRVIWMQNDRNNGVIKKPVE